MARPIQLSRERLISTMQMRGPVSATELAASLGVNRTTIVRAIADLGPVWPSSEPSAAPATPRAGPYGMLETAGPFTA